MFPTELNRHAGVKKTGVVSRQQISRAVRQSRTEIIAQRSDGETGSRSFVRREREKGIIHDSNAAKAQKKGKEEEAALDGLVIGSNSRETGRKTKFKKNKKKGKLGKTPAGDRSSN